MSRRRATASIIAVTLTAALALSGARTSAADDQPVATPGTVDELLDSFDVADTAADYVVVVDTSASMMDPPAVYPSVLQAYSTFVAAIGDQDSLSVITFDAVPNVRFAGTLETPEARAQALAALPPTAEGSATDIGAAIAAALDRLERPGSNEVQTLIFLTDGKLTAPRGSAYASPGAPAWATLTERARGVETGHRTVAYGAGLGPSATDIGLLGQVFASTAIVSLPADQLGTFFADAVERARIERLRTPVTQELAEGSVELTASAGELAPTTKVRVVAENRHEHLGARLYVRSVQVADGDGTPLEATLVGGEQEVVLAPGERRESLTVNVVIDGLEDKSGVGVTTQRRDLTVTVDATAQVEPSQVLGTALGIATETRLIQPPGLTAEREVGLSYRTILLWLVAAALLVVLLWYLYRRFLRLPPLVGGVRTAAGAVVAFRGNRMRLPGTEVIAGTNNASVEFFTRRGKFTRGRPRIYVRAEQGQVSVSKLGGPPIPLAGTQRVLITDVVVVGNARLTVQSEGATS